MKLTSSYNMTVGTAYIIRIKGNEKSEAFAQRCADSCTEVGQDWMYWDAYDGVANPIKEPEHHGQVVEMVKVLDHYLTRGEVACALSHISLWAHCAAQDRPIVILEHDSVMLKPYQTHAVFNSICYLGGKEQVKDNWKVLPTPPHASEGPNYHFICRAHAYAIDPAVARNMVAYAVKYGITAPLDIMLRADLFPIHQTGLFAYDRHDVSATLDTTIMDRPVHGRTTKRNDNLEI